MLKKIMQKLSDKKGFLLVELIVSFALLAIFMAASCTLLTSYMNLYIKINTMALGENVSETIMATLEDCLSDSRAVTINKWKRYDGSGTTIDSDFVTYTTPNGNDVIVYSYAPGESLFSEDAGLLRLLYSDNIHDIGSADVDKWSYGKEIYMNYKITSINLEKLSNNDNVIKAVLQLENTKTGSKYESKKFIECYNAVEIIQKDYSY